MDSLQGRLAGSRRRQVMEGRHAKNRIEGSPRNIQMLHVLLQKFRLRVLRSGQAEQLGTLIDPQVAEGFQTRPEKAEKASIPAAQIQHSVAWPNISQKSLEFPPRPLAGAAELRRNGVVGGLDRGFERIGVGLFHGGGMIALRSRITKRKRMIFHQVQVGGYDRNFSYIIGDERTRKAMLIDPINPDLLLPIVAKEGLEVAFLAATHGHFDHAGELRDFWSRLEPKPALAMHPSLREEWGIEGAEHVWMGERQNLTVGQLEIEAIPTPGHEPGSVCFLAQGKLMTGDTLFIGGCGRTDLPGGDARLLRHSLCETIGSLPPQTQIYPGHDYGPVPCDTLENQKRSNPYLQCGGENAFLRLRTGRE